MADQFDDSQDEFEAAEDRIRSIREGGGAEDEGLGAAEAGGSRADRLRDSIDDEPQPRGGAPARRTTTNRGRQAVIVIGGLVAIGILIVLIIFLASSLFGEGGGLPFLATATPTPTATSVPTATPTPTSTPTPTREAPSDLALPPLSCIFSSEAGGCFDYCQNPDNQAECASARDFIEAQNADADYWFECVAPGPGPNEGNPNECLKEAWREANP